MKNTKIRILLLGDINSPHIQKWTTALADNNMEVGIFSFNHAKIKWWLGNNNIHCIHQSNYKQSNSLIGKLKYIFYLPQLMCAIIKFKPQAIHSHYISSYGLLGALTFSKPFIISIWGSDIVEFPTKSILHKLIIKFVLWRADKICVSSSLLKKAVHQFTKKNAIIIPFGVDLNMFYKRQQSSTNKPFTFGCVKHFEEIYNLDKVIEAFYLLLLKHPNIPFRLKLVGDGSKKSDCESRVNMMGISQYVEFVGAVPNNEVPLHLNSLNVLINVSQQESFGVSIAEAMACKIPLIISNIEGFKDLVPDSRNAFITNSNSPEDILKVMESCYFNERKRDIAVNRSYQLVIQKFNLLNNSKQMKEVYCELTSLQCITT